MRALLGSVVVGLAAAVVMPALGQEGAPKVLMPLEVDPNDPKMARVTDVLVIGATGPGQRAVIAPDAIGAALVAGRWQPPKDGEEVRLADGSVKTWKAAKFDDKLVLRDRALQGGYAYVAYESPEPGIAILESRNTGVVYVNGEPRTGDPYGYGYARLPVKLKAGRNDILIRGGRSGEIFLRIRPAVVEFDFDMVDPMLPDVVEGQGGTLLGGLLVNNATEGWQRGWVLQAGVPGGARTRTPVDPIPPLSTRRIGFEFSVPPANATGQPKLSVGLVRADAPPDAGAPISAIANLRLRKPEESRRVTFRSRIDGSVQYYGLRPAVGEGAGKEGLPLILTLHGASVEGMGQADAYAGKPWCNIVAATNRRPYGFDWEDWGRLDAMEVLEHASAMLKADPRRVYLTGHSMGGHGTWQIGAHFPGTFAAIAPSAGWISFWSYSGAAAYDGGTPVENILKRASSPSDTLALKRNYAQQGVYILHGDADDNVPVDQAREMRKQLGEFHPDFAYYERPGAGHWWGNECVDWPPLMEFLRRHERPRERDVRRVEFVTAFPGVSPGCDWVTVEAQAEQLKPSTVDVRLDAEKRLFSGKTGNVARLCLDLSALAEPYTVEKDGAKVEQWTLKPGEPLNIELDSQKLEGVAWPTSEPRLWLVREGATWKVGQKAGPGVKGPRRAGLFKNAFTNHVLLVVGTAGTEEESAWALAKARHDAETFWYRGNGSLQIKLDTEFEPGEDPDRNVVLYGNAYSNRAWKALLGDSPIQVAEGLLTVGDKQIAGEDLACVLIRPRPGSETASVGAVSGTGVAGMRLASRVPYFVSGVGVPDWLVIGPEAMTKGTAGVRAVGFFGNDWGLSEADTGWAETNAKPEPKPADPKP